MKKTLLSVKDLKVTFHTKHHDIHAVRGVDFDLHEGEVLAIAGESGSGKSVTVKSLLKLIPSHNYSVDSGSAIYEQIDLLKQDKKTIRRYRGSEIGFIFQDPMTSLNPTMRIGDQIVEGYLLKQPRTSKNEAREYAISLLEDVGIPEPEKRVDAYPHMLSGGQRQRVMIAIALAPKPKILIADEPSTALDVTIQAQILDLLKKIQAERKMGIIFITHDLSLAAGFCDRIVVMYGGKVVENSPAKALFAKPAHPYTEGLLNAIPKLSAESHQPLSPIPGSPPNMAQKITGCAFKERCPYAMNICAKNDPKPFDCGSDQTAYCWKHDKRCKL